MEHKARKRFGQNFLQDTNVIAKIMANIRPQPGQRVVEIGPGQGALTKPLLEALGSLDVIEIDRDLIPILAAYLQHSGTLQIHQGDALKFDFRSLVSANEKLRIVGNLPYNISTPLIFHLVSYADIIQDMHFMLQKEVVDRLAAAPDTNDYGRLSVMAQYHCQVEKLFDVGPESFRPAPKVDSAIVRLIPHAQPPVKINSIHDLNDVVSRCFNQRRKTLRKALQGALTEEQIRRVGIDPQLRGETLSLAEFAALSCELKKTAS